MNDACIGHHKSQSLVLEEWFCALHVALSVLQGEYSLHYPQKLYVYYLVACTKPSVAVGVSFVSHGRLVNKYCELHFWSIQLLLCYFEKVALALHKELFQNKTRRSNRITICVDKPLTTHQTPMATEGLVQTNHLEDWRLHSDLGDATVICMAFGYKQYRPISTPKFI